MRCSASYGATAGGAAVTVVEIENRSPAPFTAALVVERRAQRSSIELDGTTLRVDGEVVLALPRAPARGRRRRRPREIVMSGDARTDAFEPYAGPIESRCCSRFRTARRGAPRSRAHRSTSARCPTPTAVARGWELQLERGHAGRAPAADRRGCRCGARRSAARARRRPRWSPRSKTGASTPKRPTAGPGSAGPGRRRARKRTAIDEPWRGDARGRCPRRARAVPRQPARRCSCASDGDVVDLLPGFPPDWLGQSITVDAVPLHARRALVRGAVARPAAGAAVGRARRRRAPDPGARPDVVVDRAAGEVLLAEPPTPLLSMGAGDRSAGTPVTRARAVLVSDEPSAADHDDLVAAGLYDPDAPDADGAARAARRISPTRSARRSPSWCRRRRRAGSSASPRSAACVPTANAGRSRGRRRAPGSTPTSRSRSGGAPGFADPRPFERRFGPDDVVVFELVRDARPTFVGRDHILQLVRTTGEAIARVARGRDRVAALEDRGAARGDRQARRRSRARTPAVADKLFPAGHRRDRGVPPPPARGDRPPLQRRERADVERERGGAHGRVRRHRGLHRPVAPARSRRSSRRCSPGSRRRPAT